MKKLLAAVLTLSLFAAPALAAKKHSKQPRQKYDYSYHAPKFKYKYKVPKAQKHRAHAQSANPHQSI
jgi:hypothetical protein